MEKKPVLFICPICSQGKRVPVPVNLIKSKESGATTVFIPKGATCEHDYYAYVDSNFTVRDYLTLDYIGGEISFETKKQEILTFSDEFDLELSQIYQYIDKKDFRSMLFAAFLEYPMIFVENNLDEDRFQQPFALICKIFPQQIERIYLYSPEKYIEFSEKNRDSLEKYIVYNTVYKLLLQKPFFEQDEEAFDAIIDILKNDHASSMKFKAVLARNTIDYLKKFACEVEFVKDKPDVLLKKLRKAYPRQAEMLTKQTLQLMRKYRPNNYRMFTFRSGVDTLHQ